MIGGRTIQKQDSYQQSSIYKRVDKRKFSQQIGKQILLGETPINNNNLTTERQNIQTYKENDNPSQTPTNLINQNKKRNSNATIQKSNSILTSDTSRGATDQKPNKFIKKGTVLNIQQQQNNFQFNRKSIAVSSIQKPQNNVVLGPSNKILKNKLTSNDNNDIQHINEIEEGEKSFWSQKINEVLTSQQTEIQENKSLKMNFIEVNESFAQGGLILQQSLSQYKGLIYYFYLSLPKRSLSEITVQQLANTLGRLQLYHLQLDLLYSYLSTKSLRCLESYFCKQITLIKVSVNLKWCKINFRKIDIIASALLNKERLAVLKLDLSCNEIGAKGFSVLFERVCEYPNLIKFEGDFTMNDIKGEGLTKAARYFKRMKSLENLSLNLNMNDIEDKGFSNFSNALGSMEKLKYLDLELQSNYVSIEGMTSLSQSLCALNNLVFLILNLYENKIPKERFEYFTTQIVNQRSLIHMELTFERCIMQQNNLICHVDKDINLITSYAHAIINTRKTPFKPYFKACQAIKFSQLKKLFRPEILFEIILFQI